MFDVIVMSFYDRRITSQIRLGSTRFQCRSGMLTCTVCRSKEFGPEFGCHDEEPTMANLVAAYAECNITITGFEAITLKAEPDRLLRGLGWLNNFEK